MATIIDAFVVTLGLDPTDYRRGVAANKADLQKLRDEVRTASEQIQAIRLKSTKETKAEDDKQIKSIRETMLAKQRSIRDLERSQKDQIARDREQSEGARKLGQGVAALTGQMVTLIAAFTAGAGLEDFIRNTIDTAAATGRLADNLGIATEDLSAWEGAVRKVGGSSKDADAAIQSLVTAFQSFQLTGTTGHDQDFNALGISAQTLKDPIKTLEAFAAAGERMSKPEFSARLSRIGIPQSTINLLEQGRAGVERLIEAQRRLGVIDAEAAKRSQAASAALSSLGDASATLGRMLLVAAEPALTALAAALTRIAEWGQTHAAAVTVAFYGLAGAMTAAAIAAAALAAPLIVAAAPVLALGAAIGAVAGAIAFLVSDFNSFREGAKSTFDWGPFVPVIARVGDALKDVGAAFGDLINAAGQLFALISPQIWQGVGAAIRDVFIGALNELIAVLHTVADLFRVVADVARHDWAAAGRDMAKLGQDAKTVVVTPLKTVAKVGGDVVGGAVAAATGKPFEPKPPAGQPPEAKAPGVVAAVGQGIAAGAAKIIASFEGFISRAKWDRNAYRVGFGSDTVTDPATGRVTRVTSATAGVTKAQAQADLARRIETEFLPKAAAAIGAAWAKLPAQTREAIASVTYNYGHVPQVVRDAARTGDVGKVADAIASLKGANGGINAKRRLEEAALARSGSPSGIGQAAAASALTPELTGGAAVSYATHSHANDNRTTVQSETNIREIRIDARGSDADGIASGIDGAIRRRSQATQANNGLS